MFIHVLVFIYIQTDLFVGLYKNFCIILMVLHNWLQAAQWEFDPQEGWDSFLCYYVQTGPEAHTASCSVDTGDSFPGCTVSEAQYWLLTSV